MPSGIRPAVTGWVTLTLKSFERTLFCSTGPLGRMTPDKGVREAVLAARAACAPLVIACPNGAAPEIVETGSTVPLL